MQTIDTAAGYDLWAPSYDQLDNPMVAMTNLAFARTPAVARRVLELGCGTGRNAHTLLAQGCGEYVGLDVSEGMLREARARRADPRVRFVHASEASALGLFDGVLISLVLEHLEDTAPLLRIAAQQLSPGGWLRILELHPGLRAQGTRAHFKHGDGELYLPSFAHDVQELQAAMGDAFRLVSACDWYADPSASEKLRRYLGKPVLLELLAVRSA